MGSHDDAVATVKSCILDGLIQNTLHPLPRAEGMVEDIFQSITAKPVLWALLTLYNSNSGSGE